MQWAKRLTSSDSQSAVPDNGMFPVTQKSSGNSHFVHVRGVESRSDCPAAYFGSSISLKTS